jgi:hypothetical protein
MDVGWVKTVEEYFTGFNPKKVGSVNTIYTLVVDQLLANQKRRFVAAEMKFFSMWFYRQNETMKDQTRQLVWSGRLELV